MRRAAEVFERVAEVEARCDLLGIQLDGWCVWPLLRSSVANALLGVSIESAVRVPRPPLQAVIAAVRGPRPVRADVFAKSYTSGLLDVQNDRFFDVWYDYLRPELPHLFKIEGRNSPAFERNRARAAYPADADDDAYVALARLGGRLWRPRHINAAADALASMIIREFGLPAFTSRWVGGWLRNFFFARLVYRRLLERLNPRVVLVADPGEQALIAAARELAIPTAEMQHGISDRYHPAYAWTSYAVPYRPALPLCDRLLLYGEHWRHELSTSGFWGADLCVTGSARIDHYRAARTAKAAEAGTQVLLTSQGMQLDAIASMVEVALRGAEPGCRLWVKLHPVYDRAGALAALQRDPRVRIVPAAELPSTFELLGRADLHVSVSSAVHYDALGLGVPTVVLDLPTADTVAQLVDDGHALLASDGAALAAIFQQPPREHISPEVSRYYFESDALSKTGAAVSALARAKTSGANPKQEYAA